MSLPSLLSILSKKFQYHKDDEAYSITLNHFQQSNQPYNDLFEYLLVLTESNHININLISCLIKSFNQWEIQSNNEYQIPTFDENSIANLIQKKLPTRFLEDFCKIFQISKDYQLYLLRNLLNDPTNSSSYKRALNIIVKFQYQFDFYPNEILLPLIINTKDQLLQIFLDKNPQLEDHLLQILNHLYDNGGKRLRDILFHEYHMTTTNVNKKALGKLAVRYWNLYGNEQNDKYPNLACLQHRRTLGYLINVKYSDTNDEKTMSDDAWNELVEDIVKDNYELSECLIEGLVDKNDFQAVNYWMGQLKLRKQTLPHWVQRYINNKTYNRSPTVTDNQVPVQKNPIDYYTLPSKDIQITFIDSMDKYQLLLDRLFNVNNENEELIIGFDCEWKPIYNNTSTSRERISIMQLAFSNAIFLLDIFYFFRQLESQSIQQRLADRLFDNDHVTILCYGFKSDASMLSAAYPVFDRALVSRRTILDLSLVQTDLLNNQPDIYPYFVRDNNTTLKDKGLSELVRLCFGKKLNKSEQSSNWERRPLRQAQILYAATDAYCLLDIYNFLGNRLQSFDYLQSFRGKTTIPCQTSTDVTSEIEQNII